MANIRINNLSFSYKGNAIFSDLCFSLRKNKTLSIIGQSGSGKTTLLKILDGKLSYSGEILIDGHLLTEHNDKIRVVYDTEKFNASTVKNELYYYLDKIDITVEEKDKRIDIINDFFSIKSILNAKIADLNENDKLLIRILSHAITYPTYLALDDVLTNLNMRNKYLLLNYLNSQNIVLINVTSNMEEVLFTDRVLCLYNGISAIDGNTLDVLKYEKVLKRLGFSLPFMYDLSIQLKLYKLIGKIYLNKEEMVRNLWK